MKGWFDMRKILIPVLLFTLLTTTNVFAREVTETEEVEIPEGADPIATPDEIKEFESICVTDPQHPLCAYDLNTEYVPAWVVQSEIEEHRREQAELKKCRATHPKYSTCKSQIIEAGNGNIIRYTTCFLSCGGGMDGWGEVIGTHGNILKPTAEEVQPEEPPEEEVIPTESF